MDFSIHDAKKAGFEKVIFIIRKENHKLFHEAIGKRVEKTMEVSYVFQELTELPEGFAIPEGRTKPFGTGHAVVCCKGVVNGPFAVINADDYYGADGFLQLYRFLCKNQEENQYALVSFQLKNTITENGSVSRGVCSVDKEGYLKKIVERTKIERKEKGIAFTEDDGATWETLEENAPVSMNLWGFTGSFLKELEKRFIIFLEKDLEKNPLKGEFFLPFVVDELLQEGKVKVQVLESADKWHGVTYPEDKPIVVEALKKMEEMGKYPFES